MKSKTDTRVRKVNALPADQIIRVVTPLGDINIGVNMVSDEGDMDVVLVSVETRASLLECAADVIVGESTIQLRRLVDNASIGFKFANAEQPATPRAPRKPRTKAVAPDAE